MDQTVWVTVRGRFVIEHPRSKGGRTYARVEVSEFALGKQPVGRWLLWLMLGPTGSRLLRFQVPTVVDSDPDRRATRDNQDAVGTASAPAAFAMRT